MSLTCAPSASSAGRTRRRRRALYRSRRTRTRLNSDSDRLITGRIRSGTRGISNSSIEPKTGVRRGARARAVRRRTFGGMVRKWRRVYAYDPPVDENDDEAIVSIPVDPSDATGGDVKTGRIRSYRAIPTAGASPKPPPTPPFAKTATYPFPNFPAPRTGRHPASASQKGRHASGMRRAHAPAARPTAADFEGPATPWTSTASPGPSTTPGRKGTISTASCDSIIPPRVVTHER